MLNSLNMYGRVREFGAYELILTLVPLEKRQANIRPTRRTVERKAASPPRESEICLLEVAVPR